MPMTFDANDAAFRDAATRRGEFRELAKDIVWKDRDYRKIGRSADTGGAIARAMEAAYKLGLSHGATPQTATSISGQEEAETGKTCVPWKAIPTRARSAFESIIRFNWLVLLVLNAEPWKSQPDKWACYSNAGENCAPDERIKLAQTFSPSTLQPLINLGLMQEKTIAEKTMLVPTELAAATWIAAIEAGHVRED
jgi:hypothetical protein